jgi:serine/threonine protein phosphatase 1
MSFPIQRFPINQAGRDFVVGDIHGCFNKLSAELDRLSFNQAIDRLFSVGDLVDRGLESPAVVEWLSRAWFHTVRGNHEQMALDYLAGDIDPDDYRLDGGAWFMALGRRHQKRIAARFNALPIAIEVTTPSGLVGIVHGDCPFASWEELVAELSSEDALAIAEVCLWNRERISDMDKSGVRGIDRVFVGHTPVRKPLSLGNVHYVDTGAVYGNPLTVLQIT